MPRMTRTGDRITTITLSDVEGTPVELSDLLTAPLTIRRRPRALPDLLRTAQQISVLRRRHARRGRRHGPGGRPIRRWRKRRSRGRRGGHPS